MRSRETWIVLVNVAFWVFLGYYLGTSQRYLQADHAEGAFTLLGLNLLLVLGAILSIASLAFFGLGRGPRGAGSGATMVSVPHLEDA